MALALALALGDSIYLVERALIVNAFLFART